jgi:hypothetical protein
MGDLMPGLKKRAKIDREIEGPVLVDAPTEEYGELSSQADKTQA